MHVIRRRGWEIPEREATPEHIFLNRRAFLAGTGAAALAMAPELAAAQRVTDVPDPSAQSLSGQAQRDVTCSTGR